MSKTKERDKIQVVAIYPIPGKDVEEVFLYREEPYYNERVEVKAGTYKLGAFTEDTIEKKLEG